MLVKLSRTELKSSGEMGHPCLVPDLSKKAFHFSPLSMMLAIGIFLYQIEEISLYS